jgi:hypothetical protein
MANSHSIVNVEVVDELLVSLELLITAFAIERRGTRVSYCKMQSQMQSIVMNNYELHSPMCPLSALSVANLLLHS